MATIDGLAALSGCAQAAGYLYYLRLSLRGDTWPNPMSWLMFAYGTALVVLIEAGAGATWRELLLPLVCTASSMVTAVVAWRKAGAVAQLTPFDWWVFRVDLALTIGYFAAKALAHAGVLSSDELGAANIAFLIGVNATTLTAFLPLLSSVMRNPESEHPGPWIIWSLAYLTLLATTALNASGVTGALLLIYPAMNFILHTDVAALAAPTGGRRRD